MNNAVIIESPQPATGSIIWLHGLGASGHDFEPIVPELPNVITQSTRFIFPHAPERPVTINGGMIMRAWYDILGMDLTTKQDEAGIRESEKILHHYISQEIEKGIPSGRIILAGFSQGGAIALQTAIRYPVKLAGVMALSTYLPLIDSVAEEHHIINKNTSIFMGHGQSDPVIPLFQGKKSGEFLEKLGYPVEWHDYPMEHTVSFEEIGDINTWLQNCYA